jgi:hypothetical protein
MGCYSAVDEGCRRSGLGALAVERRAGEDVGRADWTVMRAETANRKTMSARRRA